MKKHICIINRWSVGWDAEIPSYEKVLDHTKYKVSYIVDGEGLKGLSENIRRNSMIEEVADITSVEQLQEAFTLIKQKVGDINRLVALSEWDILNAALLRDENSIPGLTYEQALNARDKVQMKEVLSKAGIRVPVYRCCESMDDLHQLIAKVGFPIVVKPRRMAASKGVIIVHDEEELKNLADTIVFNDLECEEYCPGTVFHVDGLVKNGNFVYVIPFRYTHPPILFFKHQPLAGISINPNSQLFNKLVSFTKKAVQELHINNTQFHLELIMDESLTDPNPVFLEIGARMGGADIPRAIELLTGYNTVTQQLLVEFEEETYAPENFSEKLAAYLIVPFPEKLPSIMESNTSFKGKLSTLVDEHLRKKGEILDGTGGYLKIPARFVFFGSPQQVTEDVEKAMEEHHYTCMEIM